MSPFTLWVMRARFVLATALLWVALHYLVGWTLPRGLDRPLVLSSSPYGPLAGLLVIAVLWAGGAVVSFLVPAHGGRQALFIVGLALALWAAEGGRRGGTMDDWLIQGNATVGAPAAAPYWRLLADYVYLLVAVAGASVTSAWFSGRATPLPLREGAGGASGPREQNPLRTLPLRGGGGMTAALGRAFALDAPAEERCRGPVVLLTTAVVAGVATLILMGPVVAATYRGQVYFAVGIGLFAGVFVAQRVAKTQGLLWFWLAPFVLGVVGVLLAAIRPHLMLPPDYQHLNSIPAWSLARALPVEMIGVGLVGALWTIRGSAAEAAREAGG